MESPLVVNLELILERLRTNYDPEIDQRLLNVYQLGACPPKAKSLPVCSNALFSVDAKGSRVYGTATEKSDWDFMAVHSTFLDEDDVKPILHLCLLTCFVVLVKSIFLQ